MGGGGGGGLDEVGGDFEREGVEGFVAGFDQDVGGGRFLDGGEGDEDYFGAGELGGGVSLGVVVLPGWEVTPTPRLGRDVCFLKSKEAQIADKCRGGGNTFARVINSLRTGLAVCSSESMMSVRGLALSRRFSSFWRRSML